MLKGVGLKWLMTKDSKKMAVPGTNMGIDTV